MKSSFFGEIGTLTIPLGKGHDKSGNPPSVV
jgi:hypothetical protein